MQLLTGHFQIKYVPICISLLLLMGNISGKALDIQTLGNKTHEFKINSLLSGEYQLFLFKRLHFRYIHTFIPQNELAQLAGGSVGISHFWRGNRVAAQLGLNGRYSKGVYHQWLNIHYERVFNKRLFIYPQTIILRDAKKVYFLPAGGVCFKINDFLSVVSEYGYRFIYSPEDPVCNTGVIFSSGIFSTALYLQSSLPVKASGDITGVITFSVAFGEGNEL